MDPQRLVFTPQTCMFCDKREGPVLSQYVYLEDRMGYMACTKCQPRLSEAAQAWRATQAYGAANYLQGQAIRVRRSNGEIQAGWSLDNPFTRVDEQGQEIIHCYYAAENMGRWCSLADILSLNPAL